MRDSSSSLNEASIASGWKDDTLNEANIASDGIWRLASGQLRASEAGTGFKIAQRSFKFSLDAATQNRNRRRWRAAVRRPAARVARFVGPTDQFRAARFHKVIALLHFDQGTKRYRRGG